MKKDKEKVSSNDVLDALSIRLNDVLRFSKKNREKRNNSYFWLIKLILLVLYIFVISILFDATRDFGVLLIYTIGKSLRSVLALGWVSIISFMKGIIILYLIFNNINVFTESDFYKKLYADDKNLLKKKDNVFSTIKVVLKAISVVYLLVVGLVAALMVFVSILFIKLMLDGVYVVSPIVITLSAFAICYLTFKHIQNKFFGTKPVISNTSYILAVLVLVIGVAFFGYETSGYEYKNGLPLGFETIKQSEKFDVSKAKEVVLLSNTKLDNMKVYIDNDLVDEIRVEFEYYDTTEVSYIKTFSTDGNLYLTFTSRLVFGFEDFYDVAKLASATFSNNTIYNYNLFKYPNIKIYANEKVIKKITTKHI